ncbi:hypothetical protein RhiirA4_483092 [Rhizophagus irregularis]|uniref:Uncharacterized protein n=1 Tax=Rhizophagus irregularis TaxID=588596 RepID=A0A2I1HM51_9GLOM|nr:hypothetical protein RhiirA4_483092 [Rhizophagus irregularis]
MRLYLLVSVYQNRKQIVKSLAISIEPPELLSDLLKLALSTNDILNASISVDFQKDNSKDWHIILKEIQENLEILIFLKATHIRLVWNDDYDDINNSQAEIHKNAFNILISNATNIHLPLAQEELTEYKASSSYNQYYNNSHHKKIEIQAKTLKRHVEALENSLIQSCTSDKKWEQFIDEVIQLYATSKKYVEYLDNVNNRMHIIYSSSIPIRNGIDHIKVLDINKTSSISNKYTDIINLITLNWIWKRPDTVELFDKTKESQSLLKAHESLPKYSTRQMRKNVINKYSLYTRLSPAILCTLYQDFTGNAISNSNLIS